MSVHYDDKHFPEMLFCALLEKLMENFYSVIEFVVLVEYNLEAVTITFVLLNDENR